MIKSGALRLKDGPIFPSSNFRRSQFNISCNSFLYPSLTYSFHMYLTRDEEKVLDGGEGPAHQKAMKVLVKLGEIYSARRLVPISSAQISGVSIKTIGEPSIDFLRDLVDGGGRVKVEAAYLNPGGIDPLRWKEMGVPEELAKKQKEIIKLYAELGCLITNTCIPYDIGVIPQYGEKLAWSESSAVIFANSYFGARTNRCGGPSALMAALIGKTPEYGYHLDKNRQGDIVIDVTAKLVSSTDFAALGLYTAEIIKDCKELENKVPIFKGSVPRLPYHHKLLSAALGTQSNIALYHIFGMTRDEHLANPDNAKVWITVGRDEIKSIYDRFTIAGNKIDLVCIGCPHTSLSGLKKISELLKGKKIKKDIKFWVFTSYSIRAEAEKLGFVGTIEKAGGTIFTETCPVVAPIEYLGLKTMVTNSAKAAHYSRLLSDLETELRTLTDCVRLSTEGD